MKGRLGLWMAVGGFVGWLSLLPGVSDAGEPKVNVGKVERGNLIIELVMEQTPDSGLEVPAYASAASAPEANHHFHLNISDAVTKQFVPYLDVSVKASNLDTGVYRIFRVPAMISDEWHYGINVALPGKGRYEILVMINPMGLTVRGPKAKGRWGEGPVEVTFTYDWR